MNFFEESLANGHLGEIRLMSMVAGLTRTDGVKEDFLLPSGNTVELKTERRSTAQTPNIAVELASSPGNPGAVQRAINDGITYIVYLFSDNNFFIYSPKELLEATLLNRGKYRTVFVDNGNYETEVVLVPREALEGIRKHELI